MHVYTCIYMFVSIYAIYVYLIIQLQQTLMNSHRYISNFGLQFHYFPVSSFFRHEPHMGVGAVSRPFLYHRYISNFGLLFHYFPVSFFPRHEPHMGAGAVSRPFLSA